MSIGPQYVGSIELPWPTGRHDGPEVRGDEVNIDYGDGRWSLTGLAVDHALYSATLLSMMGLPCDPVALYWAENALPDAEAPYWVDVGRVVLSGLPAPHNQVLFACPKQYAPGLITFLDRLACAEAGGPVTASVRQRLPVVDWPLLKHISVAPPKPPTVEVDLYGLDQPDRLLFWRPPSDPWRGSVTLVSRSKDPPKTKTRR